MNLKCYYFGTALLAILILLFSCEDGGNEAEEQIADTTLIEVQSNDEVYSFVPPSPLQIASIFRRSGLEFVDDVTNPVENISVYSSSIKKQLNFGVYSADLSYCVLNNQSQDALNYMKAVRQLSDDMGMSTDMNSEQLFESFNANIGNEDSMISILATVQEGMDDYLQDSEQQYLAAIFFAGGWIEGMYIGANVAKTMNTELVKRLVEQMNILDGLIRGLHNYPNANEEIKKLIVDLELIKDIYENFSAIKGIDVEADEFSYDTVKISEEELNTLKTKINETRNWIVEV